MNNFNDTSTTDNVTDVSEPYVVTVEDKVILAVFEVLGILGFTANIVFIFFLVKFKHYTKPSFVLIMSQALADVYHNFHTSVYFYPAIVTRVNLFSHTGSLFMNAMDWAAWGITLTHMVGLSVDRLVAICFSSFYMSSVTTQITWSYAIFWWIVQVGTNMVMAATEVCCLLTPLPDYYTFDYENPDKKTNYYPFLYIPQEVTTMIVLVIVYPIILSFLFVMQRRMRKGGKKGGNSKHIHILVQIATVVCVFLSYMFVYYTCFYIASVDNVMVSMFNSLLYNINNMIHPFIYFTLNGTLRDQFRFVVFGPTKTRVAPLVSGVGVTQQITIAVRPMAMKPIQK